MNILPQEELSEGEVAEVAYIFSQPIVKKYLMVLGRNDAAELVTLGTLDMPDRNLANRHNFVSGKLAVIETLLSIKSS